ncbi:MAG: PepSY domain-containing protein [Bryobacteraceae bacterium]
MTAWIKRLHMYAGLLSLTILFIFGIVGLTGLMLPVPSERKQPEFVGREEAFAVPPNMSDRELAQAAWEKLAPPVTGPPPPFSIRRDANRNLVFQVFGPNGPTRVTVLENDGKLRVETRRNLWWQYFNVLHETHIRSTVPDLIVRLWTWYNEFSIWTLMFLSLSGIWLWLAAKPGWRWAQLSFAVGTGMFFVIYWVLS